MNPERIDVCICTYKRAEIADAIASVARQNFPAGVSIRLVVADNDVEPSARQRVADAAAAHGLAVQYVHAPARNISIARNACLDQIETPWFAFIDDDETVAPDWLARLLEHRADADIVFGPVKAQYGADAPAWMKNADIHSTDFGRDNAPTSGYAGNVLIRHAFVAEHAKRFDPSVGGVGGEDSLFFFELIRAGAKPAYAPDALAFEKVPPERASLRWLLRRRFRTGQTYADIMRRLEPQRVPGVAALALLKTLYSLTFAALSVFSTTQAGRNILRAAFHAGVVTHAFGASALARTPRQMAVSA